MMINHIICVLDTSIMQKEYIDAVSYILKCHTNPHFNKSR